MLLTPAYGRDYRSKEAVLADFFANKDFIMFQPENLWNGKPINYEQIPAGTQLAFRYDQLRKVFFRTV